MCGDQVQLFNLESFIILDIRFDLDVAVAFMFGGNCAK